MSSGIVPHHPYDGFTYKWSSEHGPIFVAMFIYIDDFLNYVHVMIGYVLSMGMSPSAIHVQYVRYHDIMYCKLMQVTIRFRSYSSHCKESHPNVITILTSFFRGNFLWVNLGIITQDQYEQGL